jgi:hypothetical protein
MLRISGICKAKDLTDVIRQAWNYHLFIQGAYRFQEPLEAGDFRERMN